MSGMLKFNRLAPRPALMRFWQTKEKLARLDCTGLTATLIGTTLPFEPTLSTIDALQGEFRIEAPTAAQLGLCTTESAYVIDVSLVDGSGERIEGCSVWVKIA